MKNRSRKKLIIFMLMSSIACLSIGFAAFSTTLNISSSASVTPNSDNFKVKFSSSSSSLIDGVVEPSYVSSGIKANSNAVINNSSFPTISNLSATFTQPGQYIEYTVYVRNIGEYRAYLNAINFNGEQKCTPVGDTSSDMVQNACEGIELSVSLLGRTYKKDADLLNAAVEKNTVMTLKITISYLTGATMSDGPFAVELPELSLVYSTVNQPGYTPSIMGSADISGTLNSKIKADALFKGTDASVDFGATPTTGVYVRSGTENHVNPIYYYRGSVTNNNVLFANKCWKIVRTTETGGTKLIYNGTPTTDNKCNGDNSKIGNSVYNNNPDVEETISYINSDGTNSTIKQTIDTWYTSNMTSYTEKLEDTVWCNDKSVLLETESYKHFGINARNASDYQPTLHCPAEYSLTVSASRNSNKLTYPIGLLTADELTLAGMGWIGYIEGVYLNNYSAWWTMSPNYFDYGFAPAMFAGDGSGSSYLITVTSDGAVRPAVSLKPGTMVSLGDGSSSKPYIIE